MKKLYLILLLLICCLLCVPFVQADQPVPFAPPANVTGNYVYPVGTDDWMVNTNFPISSQDIVYPDWLFDTILVFMFGTIVLGLIFISKDPAPWVCVIACGVVLFGLGLSAAMMAPLVGYTQVFHQIVSIVNTTSNNVYINEIIVYTMGTWVSYACYGIAVGGGLIFIITGVLLQMKEARRIANAVQAEKIQAEEIDFRKRENRRG
jgi:hypothetical protein